MLNMKGLVMKNGIYLALILFLGVMGYIVVNSLYNQGDFMLAGVVFLIVSVVISVLTSHYKRKHNLVPIQKIINFTYISVFAIYGLIIGLSLVYAPFYEFSIASMGGILFLFASFILVIGLYIFMKRNVIREF